MERSAPLIAGVLLTAGIVCLFFSRCVHGLQDPQALELAQTGRNLAEGRGLTTKVIRPFSLVFNESLDRHPDFAVPPLPALVTGGAFALVRASDRVACAASGIFLLPTLVLVYLLGRRMGGPNTGLVGALAYASSASVLKSAFAGSPVQLTAFLFTLWLYLAAREDGSQDLDDELHSEEIPEGVASEEYECDTAAEPGAWRSRQVASLGAVFGLLILSEWRFAWLWGLAAAHLAWIPRAQRPIAKTAVFLIGTVAVSLPWLIRNTRLTGNPMFTLRSYLAVSNTDAYPGTTLMRSTSPLSRSAITLAARSTGPVGRKLLSGLVEQRTHFCRWLDALLLSAVVVALLAPGGALDTAGVRRLFASFLLADTVLACVLEPRGDLMPFAPVGVALAANALVNLVTQSLDEPQTPAAHRAQHYAQAGLVSLVLALAAVPAAVSIVSGAAGRNRDADLHQLAEAFEPATVILSDAPWSVAWYGNRTAIWLPETRRDLAFLENKYKPRVAGMVLTRGTQTLGGAHEQDQERWHRLYLQPRYYAGYEPKGRLRNGAVVFHRLTVEPEEGR